MTLRHEYCLENSDCPKQRGGGCHLVQYCRVYSPNRLHRNLLGVLLFWSVEIA